MVPIASQGNKIIQNHQAQDSLNSFGPFKSETFKTVVRIQAQFRLNLIANCMHGIGLKNDYKFAP